MEVRRHNPLNEQGHHAVDIAWIEGRREYQLMMDANVKAPGSPNLLELARSLAKSVPGGQLDGSFKGFPETWDSK